MQSSSPTPTQAQNEQAIDWHRLWHESFISLAVEYGGLHNWWSVTGKTTPEEEPCYSTRVGTSVGAHELVWNML